MGASFLGIVKDDPKAIMSLVKMLKENLDRGYAPAPTPRQVSSRKLVEKIVGKILALENDVEKSGQVIIDIYDDLLDEMINAGLGEFM